MEKYNKLLGNITELIEKGLFTSKDLKKEVEDSIKFKMEIIANKLNLVSREEFEVQKKIIAKLQKDLTKLKTKKTILRDSVTKKEYEISESYYIRFSRGSTTNALVEVLRDKHSCNVVNFYLVDRFRHYDAAEFSNADIPPQMILSKFKKEGHLIAENYGGWSELYLIKGGNALGVEESILEVKEDAKRGEIKRAFSKFNKGKLKNRLVLSKFVDMVAA